MTLRSDLIAARALIDTPEKWGKGPESFINGYAYAPNPRTPMCALGACAAAAMRDAMWDKGGEERYVDANYAVGDVGLTAAFNDATTTTHADIMSLFQRAIDNAGERE